MIDLITGSIGMAFASFVLLPLYGIFGIEFDTTFSGSTVWEIAAIPFFALLVIALLSLAVLLLKKNVPPAVRNTLRIILFIAGAATLVPIGFGLFLALVFTALTPGSSGI